MGRLPIRQQQERQTQRTLQILKIKAVAQATPWAQ